MIFDVVPIRSGYHALLERTAFTQFNVVPHYAYLKLKMPGPCGLITFNGNMERSRRTEEHTVALTVEAQGGLIKPNINPAVKPSNTIKRVRSTPQNDNPARPKLDLQSSLPHNPN